MFVYHCFVSKPVVIYYKIICQSLQAHIHPIALSFLKPIIDWSPDIREGSATRLNLHFWYSDIMDIPDFKRTKV